MKEDGGGIRQENHLLLHKYIKNSSEYGTTPTTQTSECQQKTSNFKKRQIKLLRMRQGKRRKQETNNFKMGLAPQRGNCKGGSLNILRNPLTGEVQGRALESQMGVNSGCSEGKMENSPHISLLSSTSQLRSSSYASLTPVLYRGGAGCKAQTLVSDPREKTEVDCYEDTLSGQCDSRGTSGKRLRVPEQ